MDLKRKLQLQKTDTNIMNTVCNNCGNDLGYAFYRVRSNGSDYYFCGLCKETADQLIINNREHQKTVMNAYNSKKSRCVIS